MKKGLLLSFLFIGMFLATIGQNLVSTEPMPRNAVLEEFTGIYCGYCPDGHAIAADLLENNPGRMVVIAVHAGSYAAPSGDDPDFRTEFGDALVSQAGVTGYPSGTVNRHEFDGMQQGSGTAMSRGNWSAATELILAEDSPLNVGIETSYEESTRELTVNVELYYTDDATEESNFINVAITQSHILGPQSGGDMGDNYEHMHMLRHLITGQWGEEITPTTTGTLIQRTYNYTLPEAINDVDLIAEDCEVAVFVTETTQEIITGDVVDLMNGTNLFIGSLTTAGEQYAAGTPGIATPFDLEVNSNIDGDEDFTFTLTADAPTDWNSSFTVNGTSYDETATITVSYDSPLEMLIDVVPGETEAIGSYIMSMVSESNPEAPEQQITFYVVSGLTDLLVNGTGGSQTTEHQQVYLDALAAAGNTSHDVVRGDIFANAYNADALEDIDNVYFNVAWTFPSFTDAQAIALKSFMDNGGNVFVAGQDIGWDIMSGDGNGNNITQDLYTNYFAAEYQDDGSSSNSLLTANEDDENFGTITDSDIVDMYDGNMYPDEMSPLGDATVSFYYNNNSSKGACIYNETETYTSIFFGIGMEMIADQQVVNDIIAKVHDLWTSGVSTHQIDPDSFALGQNYPNPAKEYTCFTITSEQISILTITDINGRIISEQEVTAGTTLINLNTSAWTAGIYYYTLGNPDQRITKKLIKL